MFYIAPLWTSGDSLIFLVLITNDVPLSSNWKSIYKIYIVKYIRTFSDFPPETSPFEPLLTFLWTLVLIPSPLAIKLYKYQISSSFYILTST